jgi:4-hydroxy-tetrahydrodipicolinate reductase
VIGKVGILGVSGRMGLEIAGLLADGFEHKGVTLELADAVASSDRLTTIEGIPVRRLEAPPREPVHVWIDFSRPAGTVELLKRNQGPVVIGTTGFDEAQLATVRAYSQKHPVLLAPNTSPGMNLVLALLKQIPRGLTGFDVVLEEGHHKHKKDSPSGTAKAMIAALESAGHPPGQVLVTRAGGIVGVHAVKLISNDEEITIEHRVADRKVFARGALQAAAYLLQQKKPGMYQMSDVFAT